MTWRRLPLLALALATASLQSAVLPDAAAAQTVALTPEQISGFNQQIARARQTQATIGESEACVAVYSADLQRRGGELETALADSLRLEQALSAEVDRLEDERRRFSEIASAEQVALDDRRRDLQSAVAEQQEQDRRLQTCRRVMTFLAFLCDWGDQAVRDLGWMRNVRAEIGGIEARLENARNGVLDAERNLAASQAALTATESRILAHRTAISEVEAEIVRVKKTIAELHVMTHDYNTLLDDFASLLGQAEAVDAGSTRARQLLRLSAGVDEFVSRAPTAVSAVSAFLPADVKQACSHP